MKGGEEKFWIFWRTFSTAAWTFLRSVIGKRGKNGRRVGYTSSVGHGVFANTENISQRGKKGI